MMQLSEFDFEPEALEVRRQTLDNRSKKIYKKKSKESTAKTSRKNIEELSSQGYYAKPEGKAFDSPTSSAQSYSTSDVTPFLKAGKSRKLSKLNSFRLNTYQRISLKKKKQPTLNQIFLHFDSFNPSVKDKLLSVPVNKICPMVIDQLIDEMPLGEEMRNHEVQLQKIRMLSQAQERDLELFMNNQVKETEDIQKYRDYLTYMAFRSYYCQKSQELIADKKTLMLYENSPYPVVSKILSPEKSMLAPLVLNNASSPKQEALAPSTVQIHGSPFYKGLNQPKIPTSAAEAMKLSEAQISSPQIQPHASDENSYSNLLTQKKLVSLPKYNLKEHQPQSGSEANNFEGCNWQSPLIFKHRANTAFTDSETIVDTARRGSNIWSEQFDTAPIVNNKAEIEASNDYFRKRVFSSNKLEDITDLLIDDDDEKIYHNEKLFSLSDEFSQNNSQPPIKEEDLSHERDLERGLCTMINERMIAYDI